MTAAAAAAMGPKVLVIGGVGELGRSTVLAAKEHWVGGPQDVVATYRQSQPDEVLKNAASEWVQLDCSDHEATRKTIMNILPAAIIYCAVPKHGGAASKGSDEMLAGISDDVVAAAEAGKMVGARFVAVSTDQVWDGKLETGKYKETDPVSPTNPYAAYKTVMEKRLADIGGSIAICRTSLILTLEPMGKGIQFVVDCLAGKKGEIVLFTDELRNMTFSDDLGSALVELADPQCSFRGILNLVADEITNRYELAKLLAKKFGYDMTHVKSGLSAESGLNRPRNLSMDTTVVNQTLKRTKLRGVSEKLRSD
mmetsp:Transcript_12065/g.36770  ORF Transcript_12065/g.36770 Transcript_12065/m.36770 type:complete len:310 (+) Transcript_12065:11-940(+)